MKVNNKLPNKSKHEKYICSVEKFDGITVKH